MATDRPAIAALNDPASCSAVGGTRCTNHGGTRARARRQVVTDLTVYHGLAFHGLCPRQSMSTAASRYRCNSTPRDLVLCPSPVMAAFKKQSWPTPYSFALDVEVKQCLPKRHLDATLAGTFASCRLPPQFAVHAQETFQKFVRHILSKRDQVPRLLMYFLKIHHRS